MPHNLLDALASLALLYSDHYISQPFDTPLSHYLMFKLFNKNIKILMQINHS